MPIPDNYPVIGRDAFRTATGVHAAAVVKAWRKKDRELMDLVYSAIPASLVGREQEIDVGPMSGKSNVIFWLEKRGMTATDAVVDRIFQKAKASPTVLTEEEILAAMSVDPRASGTEPQIWPFLCYLSFETLRATAARCRIGRALLQRASREPANLRTAGYFF